MRDGFGSDAKRGLRSEHGSVAVEFAILAPLFLVLVFGVMDFGHAFYIKQVVSNASREGARYGTRYTGSAANTLNPSINNYVLKTSAANGNKGGVGLTNLLLNDNPTVPTPTGSGYTDPTPGNPLYVTVTATKTWWIVNKFIPGMEPTATIQATTCMAVE